MARVGAPPADVCVKLQCLPACGHLHANHAQASAVRFAAQLKREEECTLHCNTLKMRLLGGFHD